MSIYFVPVAERMRVFGKSFFFVHSEEEQVFQAIEQSTKGTQLFSSDNGYAETNTKTYDLAATAVVLLVNTLATLTRRLYLM